EPVAVQVELDDVVLGDQAGTARARQEIARGVVGMTDADVTEGVHDAFVCEDSVRHHQVADRCRHILVHTAHASPSPRTGSSSRTAATARRTSRTSARPTWRGG